MTELLLTWRMAKPCKNVIKYSKLMYIDCTCTYIYMYDMYILTYTHIQYNESVYYVLYMNDACIMRILYLYIYHDSFNHLHPAYESPYLYLLPTNWYRPSYLKLKPPGTFPPNQEAPDRPEQKLTSEEFIPCQFISFSWKSKGPPQEIRPMMVMNPLIWPYFLRG